MRAHTHEELHRFTRNITSDKLVSATRPRFLCAAYVLVVFKNNTIAILSHLAGS